MSVRVPPRGQVSDAYGFRRVVEGSIGRRVRRGSSPDLLYFLLGLGKVRPTGERIDLMDRIQVDQFGKVVENFQIGRRGEADQSPRSAGWVAASLLALIRSCSSNCVTKAVNCVSRPPGVEADPSRAALTYGCDAGRGLQED